MTILLQFNYNSMTEQVDLRMIKKQKLHKKLKNTKKQEKPLKNMEKRGII